MSDKLPQQNPNEEIDLGQLFNAIGRLFEKIGEFIKSVFKILLLVLEKVGVLLLVFINIVKKHFFKIVIPTILVFALFVIMGRLDDNEYKSDILISQNYQTGRLLYSTVGKLNLLASSNDSLALSKDLKIPLDTAGKIKGFEVANFMNQNQLELEYYDMLEKEDSLSISLDEYIDYKDLENFASQQITVKSNDTEIFTDELSDAIVQTFEKNSYYNEERSKKLAEIDARIKVLENSLRKSEELQKEYVNLLKTYYNSDAVEPDKTTVNLNLNNSKEKVNTKEFDLLNDQKQMELEINLLQSSKANIKDIVRVQKGFNQPVIVKNIYKKYRNYAALITFLIFTLIFLFKEFNISSFIEEQGQLNRLKK